MIIRTSAILQNDALIIAPAGNMGIPKIASSERDFSENERSIPDENLKWGLPPSLFYRIYRDTFPDFQALRCDIHPSAGPHPTAAPMDAAQCRTQPGTGRAGQRDISSNTSIKTI